MCKANIFFQPHRLLRLLREDYLHSHSELSDLKALPILEHVINYKNRLHRLRQPMDIAHLLLRLLRIHAHLYIEVILFHQHILLLDPLAVHSAFFASGVPFQTAFCGTYGS